MVGWPSPFWQEICQTDTNLLPCREKRNEITQTIPLLANTAESNGTFEAHSTLILIFWPHILTRVYSISTRKFKWNSTIPLHARDWTSLVTMIITSTVAQNSCERSERTQKWPDHKLSSHYLGRGTQSYLSMRTNARHCYQNEDCKRTINTLASCTKPQE